MVVLKDPSTGTVQSRRPHPALQERTTRKGRLIHDKLVTKEERTDWEFACNESNTV
jgi:hypothetical protein